MSKIFIAVMSKFIKSKILNVDKNGSKSYKDVNELLTINVQDPKNCKPLKMIEIGTKAKSYFTTTLEMSNDKKKFC